MAISGVPIESQIPIEDIIRCIYAKKGLVIQVREELGIEANTFYRVCARHPEVQEALDLARVNRVKDYAAQDEELLTLAYQSMKSHLLDKEIAATIFTMKTKGGYNEKIISDATTTQKFVSYPYESKAEKPSDPIVE